MYLYGLIMTDTADAVIVRGPRDALGSEFSLVQNADGMWNATLMGTQGGRAWKDFLRNDRTKAYIQELGEQLGLPESSVVKYERAEKGPGGSTWIHRRLAFQFIAHQSPKFAVWADGVIERYIDGKITTEESKAAKAAVDALLEDGRVKYEASLKRLAAFEKALDMQKQDHNVRTRRLAAQVHTATEEADELRAKLAKNKKKETKKGRLEDNKTFLADLRNALKTDRANSWVDLEDGFGKDDDGQPMTIPAFVQYLHGFCDHEWMGKEYDVFSDRPGVGWNIVPLQKFHEAPAEDFRLYTNFVPAFNHSDRHKVLVDAGDNPEYVEAPIAKRARRE